MKSTVCEKSSKRSLLAPAGASLLLLIACILFFAAQWYVHVFGRMGFDAILFTLSNLQGTSGDMVHQFILSVLVPAAVLTALLVFLLYFKHCRSRELHFRNRCVTVYPVRQHTDTKLCCALSALLLLHAAFNSGLIRYIGQMLTSSAFIEEQYVDPDTVAIEFPEERRNLIYIFMESMETSFLAEELGGTLEETAIPELYTLAHNNVNFSHNDDVGGYVPMEGMKWTIAGMVSQTAGVPLKTPTGIQGNDYGKNGLFLPGITTLMDILSQEGYYQAVMFGSDAAFAGRDAYYKSHGTDQIYDYYTAITDEVIPQGYEVWWGFEDAKLFPYAKDKLTELAAQDQPFSFTLLTADTHHVDGYLCPDCPDDYPEQYENVYACSSRKVADFVEWIQQQDFYENTTIILCGDHCSMDNAFFKRNADDDYERHVYNCIINPAAEAVQEKNRTFTAVDLFPTTLAAMGCEIEGNRLGLGTNLFSDVPTLSEEFGFDFVDNHMGRYSRFYQDTFLQPVA